ncbi:CrcB family protein [Metabacillus sp. KIGAM252]|uniref:Fluoride-specific ion channel FluC n=1 Tax=Metabacillus flavus TaxID=2823519 RepID=A0ABS5LBQ5_9BACI|nr:CrcB family protein [Metabacillus flavus]MBS2968152.1 CrcB family protein [Metabacillus flavus]
MNYFAIGLAGAAGALLRYATGLAGSAAGFPAGTFFANITGCFLLSFLTAAVFKMDRFPKKLAAPIGTGLIGSYTTFSAFSIEAVQLMDKGDVQMALLYIGASAVLGFLFSITGIIAGSAFLERRVRE